MTTCPMSSVCNVYDGAVFCIHSPGTGTQSRHTAEHSSARRAICSDTPTRPTRMLKHSDTSPCNFLLPLVSMGSVQRGKGLIVHPLMSTHGRGWAGRVSFCPLVLITRLGGAAESAPGTRPPVQAKCGKGSQSSPLHNPQIADCRL